MGLIPTRTQSSVALASGKDWWLVNASSDLRTQIEACPDLQPSSHSSRNSPIRGVLLTNADLDHLLGLFSLREGERLEVYAAKETWDTAANALRMAEVLGAFCQVTWREPNSTFSPLPGKGSPLLFRSIPLPGNPPPYAKGQATGGGHSVAYQFLDQSTGGRLLVAPDVAAPNRELLEALADSDAILFDGTFWSAEELTLVKPGAKTAQQMGHVTIRDGSLDLLRKTAARHKIYTHINNTNPILSPGTAERAAVEAAGIQVGYDGLQFEV